MSNEELILKYLDRQFNIVIRETLETREPQLIRLTTDNISNIDDVITDVKIVFGDSLLAYRPFVKQWYSNKLRVYTSQINNFLDCCTLKLDDFKWITIHNELGVINREIITSYYGDPHSLTFNFHQSFYDAWYKENVIIECEKEQQLKIISNEDIFFSYMNSFYYIKINEDDYDDEDDIKIYTIGKSRRLRQPKVLNDIYQYFEPIDTSLDLIITSKMFDKWLLNELDKHIPEIKQFISECEVVSSDTNWKVVHKHNGDINGSMLKEYFTRKIPLKTVSSLFYKWRDKEIISIVEKELENKSTPDEELILKYINSFYYINMNYLVNICDLKTDKLLKLHEVSSQIDDIFGNLDLTSSVLNKWYNEKREIIIPDFDVFLNECEIVLGLCEWEVRHKLFGNIDINLLNIYYPNPNNVPIAVLKAMFKEWYAENIYIASEKEMQKN